MDRVIKGFWSSTLPLLKAAGVSLCSSRHSEAKVKRRTFKQERDGGGGDPGGVGGLYRLFMNIHLARAIQYLKGITHYVRASVLSR